MTAIANDQDDARDMVALAAGEDRALDALMARHATPIFRYLLRSLQNEAEAQDLAQEVFVRIYQSRLRFDPRQRFTPWLYQIASNLVRDRYRWRTRHSTESIDGHPEEDHPHLHDTLVAPGDGPVESLAREERAETVRRAIAALPEELRLPLILSEYEGRSHTDIGTILNCSAKAVEMRLYRARQQLRIALAKWL